jgi:hypothetical protein
VRAAPVSDSAPTFVGTHRRWQTVLHNISYVSCPGNYFRAAETWFFLSVSVSVHLAVFAMYLAIVGLRPTPHSVWRRTDVSFSRDSGLIRLCLEPLGPRLGGDRSLLRGAVLDDNGHTYGLSRTELAARLDVRLLHN